MANNKPISIEFIADVSKYLSEVKKVEVSTDDIAEALVAVTNSGDDLERKLGKAMKDASKDAEILEKAIKNVGDAADKMGDDARRGFDKVGDAADDAKTRAADSGREVGSEFRENLGEALAQGDVKEAFAETLSAAVGGMGGAIGVAGSILAGGALLVWNKMREEAARTAEAIAAQTESLWSSTLDSIESGIGNLSVQITNSVLATKELNRLWEESSDEMTALVNAGKELNINANDLVRARAGDEEALKRVNEQLDTVYAKQGTATDGALQHVDAIRLVEDGIKLAGEATDLNNAKTQAYNDSVAQGAPVWGSVEAAIEKVATSTEGVRDAALEARIAAADIDGSGFLDQTEIMKANLQDILTKAGAVPDPNMPGGVADSAAIAANMQTANYYAGLLQQKRLTLQSTSQGFTSTPYQQKFPVP